jgi:hypothetical protein
VPPATLLEALAPIAAAGPFRYERLVGAATAFRLVALLDGTHGAIDVTVQVLRSPPHLIDGLLFKPAAQAATSWQATDAELQRLASRVGLLAAEVRGGRLQVVHAFHAERSGPIGSAFKLYVLGTLAETIAAGQASWHEQLAIHDAWKSVHGSEHNVPASELQSEPAGKRFTLERYARQMIALSDNTATDHLIHRLGRARIEHALAGLGHHAPDQTTPLLTTREMTILKIDAPAALRRAYERASAAERRRLLPQIDAIPLSIKGLRWTKPIAIDTLEWFASPADLGRALAALERLAARPGLAPVRAILAANPGIDVDRHVWRYVGFKGGSEVGVLCLAWYLERTDGRAYVMTIELSDPSHDIDTLAAVSAAQAATTLLARD